MKVIITNDRIEIYREEHEEAHGDCCEFASWMLAWAIGRCQESIRSGIDGDPRGRVLCD